VEAAATKDDREVAAAVTRGDYPLAYLMLFRRLAGNSGGEKPAFPTSPNIPNRLDATCLSNMAESGNPWLLARALGVWLARQQGYALHLRKASLAGIEYVFFPVGKPAAAWPKTNLRHWFHPFWPVPRFVPLKRQSDTLIEVDSVHLPELLGEPGDSRSIKVFAAEFCDQVKLDTRTADGKFHCSGLQDPDTRWQSIENALEQARKWRADIILMPELSVTEALRKQLAAWLRQNKGVFRLVIAGSFHQDDGKGNNVNRCVLFRGNGQTLAEFDKWLPYRSKENIVPGKRLLMLNTVAGLWAPAICLDFVQRKEDSRESHPEFPWESISGDLLLVASMGHESTVTGHQERAKSLAAEFYPRVVVANMTPESDGLHPGFVQETGEPRRNIPPHSMWPSLYSV
jgi:hypothetical protein